MIGQTLKNAPSLHISMTTEGAQRKLLFPLPHPCRGDHNNLFNGRSGSLICSVGWAMTDLWEHPHRGLGGQESPAPTSSSIKRIMTFFPCLLLTTVFTQCLSVASCSVESILEVFPWPVLCVFSKGWPNAHPWGAASEQDAKPWLRESHLQIPGADADIKEMKIEQPW